MNGISVIICCFNSENRIRPTLEHISKLVTENLVCEVIIVDNNCTDRTIELSKRAWKEFGEPFELIIIHESNSGQSFARKLGVLKARGEIIVFCDDDNWLSNDYLINAYNILSLNYSIGALGGRSYPIFENNEPFWFSTFQSAYAVGVQNLNSGDVTKRGYLWGAGLIIRKEILINLYESGFDNVCTGRLGTVLYAGDDSEICKWLILVGYKLWYDENLIFGHFITENRLNKKYLENLNIGFINSSSILLKYDELILYISLDCKILFISKKIVLNLFKILLFKKGMINQFLVNLQLIFMSVTWLKFDNDIYYFLKSRRQYLTKKYIFNKLP